MNRLKELLLDEPEEIESSESENLDYIEVLSYSIEEGLENASKKLKVGIADLEYEILERGSPGFLGIGRKPYRLLVRATTPKVPTEILELTKKVSKGIEVTIPQDVDGTFKIRVTKRGIFLIVTKPKGKGRKVSVQEVLNALYDKQIVNIDQNLIQSIVEKASGEPVKIGEWAPNPEYDGKMNIEISNDEMKVFLTLIPPRRNGRIVEFDDIMAELQKRNVVFGIKEDVIKDAVENDKFNQAIVIAEGRPPQNGEDAKIDYKFRIEKDIKLTEDEKGRVDFRELDLIENVVIGQVLAVKIPATKGVPGMTVFGKELPAKDGKDIPLIPGKNVKLSEDGMQLIAEINGQVVYAKDRVNVEPVYEVKGDVSVETGNIVFLGTVIVRGNVEDGFSVKAAGNIDVRGSVGKATLEAEGDIIIKQGLLGKDEAEVRAGNDVIAKFLERAKLVEAGRDVIVAEGIMHSYVDAGKRVICNGKRAIIVGGRVRAGEEVNAKTIGSPSFTETIIETGMDPKSRQQLIDLQEELRVSKEKVRELSMNITTLQNQKRAAGGKLSPEKEELLLNMLQEKESLTIRITEVEEQINEIKNYLASLESKGKVAVQNVIYPKVKITIKDATLEVRDEFKYVTFYYEAGNIGVHPYEEAKVDKEKKGKLF